MRVEGIKRRVVTYVLASAMLPAIPAVAAVDAYMTINGTKQGQFKGEELSDRLSVTSVSHDMNMASGMAAGRRQHGAITIRREVDKASPMLMKAMNAHESLNDVTIVFPASGAGAGKVAQTINLRNAMITAVRVSGQTEAVTIEYETIQVTYVNGNKSATDDWEAPN